MLLKTPDIDPGNFYNITLEEIDGASSFFVTKYEDFNEETGSYEGKVATYRVAGDVTSESQLKTLLTQVFESIPDSSSGNNGPESSGGSSEYPYDCNGYVKTTSVISEVKCACGHSWQDYLSGICKGCTSSPKYPSMSTSYVYECISNNSNPSTSGSSTGGTNTGGATGTVTPIEDVEPLPEEPSTPCVKLKNMINNPKLKNAIVALQSKTGRSEEFGYSVTKNIATGDYNTPVPAYASTTTPNNIYMPTGGNNIGSFHTHPIDGDGWYPMFSDGDLHYLYSVALKHNNNGAT